MAELLTPKNWLSFVEDLVERVLDAAGIRMPKVVLNTKRYVLKLRRCACLQITYWQPNRYSERIATRTWSRFPLENG